MKEIRATIRTVSKEEGQALTRQKVADMQVKLAKAKRDVEQLTKIIEDYKRMYPYLEEGKAS